MYIQQQSRPTYLFSVSSINPFKLKIFGRYFYHSYNLTGIIGYAFKLPNRLSQAVQYQYHHTYPLHAHIKFVYSIIYDHEPRIILNGTYLTSY